MSMNNLIQEALNNLDAIGTQASALSTLGDLLYAVDAESEHLGPETLNNIACLLDVISMAMLESGFEVRKKLEKLAN